MNGTKKTYNGRTSLRWVKNNRHGAARRASWGYAWAIADGLGNDNGMTLSEMKKLHRHNLNVMDLTLPVK